MSITHAMQLVKRELDNVPALDLREFLDDLCSEYRNISVRFEYFEEPATRSQLLFRSRSARSHRQLLP